MAVQPVREEYKDVLARIEARIRRSTVVFPRLVDEVMAVIAKSGAWEMKEPIFDDLRSMAEIVDGNKSDTVSLLTEFQNFCDDMSKRIDELP